VLPVVVLVPGVLLAVVEEPALEAPDAPADVPAELPDDPAPEAPPEPPPPPCAKANVEPRASVDASATVVSLMFVSLGFGDRGQHRE
jgi:hypothetical protein